MRPSTLVAGASVLAITAAIVAPRSSRSTPAGALNPAVNQSTINTTICVPGYTASIRRSLSTRPGFEHDHLIPLELGGAPSDPKNLWFERQPQARKTDVEETHLHALVCAGQVTLGDAQHRIAAFKRSHG